MRKYLDEILMRNSLIFSSSIYFRFEAYGNLSINGPRVGVLITVIPLSI